MPVTAVNLPVDVLHDIMVLVGSGDFRSPEHFLEVAARNQLVYEQAARAETKSRSRSDSPLQFNGDSANGALRMEPSGASEWIAAFRMDDEPKKFPSVVSPRIEAGQRVWGQINRLLPIKLAARFVLVSSAGKQNWPPLSEALKPMGEAAAGLGSHLQGIDTQSDRKRDELVATGLPRFENEASIDRFLTQFVARTTRDGKVYPGAVCQYPLAAIENGRLSLTELGVQFASLDNPILDEGRADSTLSDEEREFFVSRIVGAVPRELQDIKATVEAVQAGHTSPETLTATLADVIRNEDLTKTWTDVMMRTHVSGVVSRMVDMGLLRRRWEGRRVSYVLAPLAAQIDGASTVAR